MKSFQQKRGLRNILNSRPVLALLIVLVAFFAYGIIGFMGKMQTTASNRKIAENKVSELEKEKEKLASDIERLKTQSGIEASIREKFGLASEGENMIVVVEDKNKPKVIDTQEEWFWPPLYFWKNWFK